jgi:hypothetical protein
VLRVFVRTLHGLTIMAAAAVLMGAECNRGGSSGAAGMSESDLSRLYGPQRIEVLPFTKFRSFDSDEIPDGIEVALRPLDEMDDPVKVYGTFRFELFEYRQASGNRAGAPLEGWTQPILSADDQKRFWDRVTSTYTFQLAWEGGEFPAVGKKYLLQVTFEPPGGKRLFTEYAFEFNISRGRMLQDAARRRQP